MYHFQYGGRVRIASLWMFIVVSAFWGCGTKYPSGEVPITEGAVEQASCSVELDTTGHQKYEVSVTWVESAPYQPSDSVAGPVVNYNVEYWTRDETGALRRHGAILEMHNVKDKFTRARYSWFADSMMTVRFEAATSEQPFEMHLYGWKNVSGGMERIKDL